METIDTDNIIIEHPFVSKVMSDSVLIYRPAYNWYRSYGKRYFDVTVAALLTLLLLSWLTPLLYVLIRLTSKGPGLFVQKRIGLNGAVFLCYKFRTMYVNDKADTLQCTQNDRRITVIGSILRKTHLDELPQLINVLKGDMSIIGPRPHMITDDASFELCVQEYKYRRIVRPGITGLAQVKGYYGATHNAQQIKDRVRLDLCYIRKISFAVDLNILLTSMLLPFKTFMQWKKQ